MIAKMMVHFLKQCSKSVMLNILQVNPLLIALNALLFEILMMKWWWYDDNIDDDIYWCNRDSYVVIYAVYQIFATQHCCLMLVWKFGTINIKAKIYEFIYINIT